MGANSNVSRSYRGKTGRGGWLFAPFPTPSWIGLKHIIFRSSRSKMFYIYSEKFWKGKHSHLRSFSFDKDTDYRLSAYNFIKRKLRNRCFLSILWYFLYRFFMKHLWTTAYSLYLMCLFTGSGEDLIQDGKEKPTILNEVKKLESSFQFGLKL